ncbi:MAG TPA: Rpn family recombination-promoting nuclease/putative transposase [Kofleriaceae bacterium]
MTPRPHDALFKSAFEAPADAAALLRELLPAGLRAVIAWDTLHGEPGSFVHPALADQHSDLLFSARLRTEDSALVHILLEHQSTTDPAMPLRTLTYQTRIWNRFRKNHPAAWLPPALNVLVSHAPGGWTTSRSLDDMLAPSVLAIPDLAASVPRSPLIVDDLAELSNEDLKARSLGAFQKLALWLLRDARDPRRLLDNFTVWIEDFAEAERAPSGIDAIAALLTYLFRVVDPVHHDELRAKIDQLGPHAEESAMTIAEQLHEEGREQGLAQGREQGLAQGRIAALRALLTFKFGSQALDATHEAQLQAATPTAIDQYLQRVLTADSLAAVFED